MFMKEVITLSLPRSTNGWKGFVICFDAGVARELSRWRRNERIR